MKLYEHTLKKVQILYNHFLNLYEPLSFHLVLCRTQIFRVSSEYERRFSSIFEHEHRRALDIRTSSGTSIKIRVSSEHRTFLKAIF